MILQFFRQKPILKPWSVYARRGSGSWYLVSRFWTKYWADITAAVNYDNDVYDDYLVLHRKFARYM